MEERKVVRQSQPQSLKERPKLTEQEKYVVKQMQFLDPSIQSPYLTYHDQPKSAKTRVREMTEYDWPNIERLELRGKPDLHQDWAGVDCTAEIRGSDIFVTTKDDSVDCRYTPIGYDGGVRQMYLHLAGHFDVVEACTKEVLTFDVALGCYRTMTVEV